MEEAGTGAESGAEEVAATGAEAGATAKAMGDVAAGGRSDAGDPSSSFCSLKASMAIRRSTW